MTSEEFKGKAPLIFSTKINYGNPDDCWEWNAYKNQGGYGVFLWKGKPTKSHRVAYLIANGEFDNKLCVLHNCPNGDNRACCNPAHLWLGTKDDNNKDRAKKGRSVVLHGSKNGKALLKEEDVLRIKQRLKNGECQHKIAADYGVSRGLIGNINIGASWKRVPGETNSNRYLNMVHHKGSAHYRAKLNESDVLLIKTALRSGESQRKIAKRFNISQTVIGRINTGELWKHVHI